MGELTAMLEEFSALCKRVGHLTKSVFGKCPVTVWDLVDYSRTETQTDGLAHEAD